MGELTAADWIRPRLSGRWATATWVTPDSYSAYVRIFHPVEDGPPYEGMATWEHVASTTGRTMHADAQWWRLIDAPPDPRTPASDLWLGGNPWTGQLDPDVSRILYPVLVDHTSTPADCYFAVWEGSAWYDDRDLRLPRNEGTEVERTVRTLAQGPRIEHPGRRYVLLHGPVRDAVDVGRVLGKFGPSSPNIVWPADRAWCLATEIDYDSTIVACSPELRDALLATDGIEAMAIGPDTRLDSEADSINAASSRFA